MINYLKSVFYAVFVLLILSACSNNDSPLVSLVIKDAYVENSSFFNAGDTITLKYNLVSSADNNDIEIIYSLVSTSADETVSGDEDNQTTIIIPNTEYHIGGTQLDLQTGLNEFNASVTLPIDMQEGEYYLALKLDGKKSQKVLAYPNGDVFRNDDVIYTIGNANVYSDIVIKEYTLDEDVLLLSKDQNHSFSSTISLVSKHYDSQNIPISVCLEIDGDCKDLNILSSNGVFSPLYIVEKLSGHTTHISLELEVPMNVSNEIMDIIQNNIHTVKVRAYVDKEERIPEQGNDENNQAFASLTLYNVNQALLTKDDDALIEFSKDFTLKKMKKTSGALLAINSKAAVELEKTYAYSHGNLDLKILSKKFNFLYIGVDATFVYDSFADTGITRSFKFLGHTIQEYKDFRDDIKSGIDDFNDIKNQIKSLPENWNTTMEIVNSVNLIQIAADATEVARKKINSANKKKINAIIKSTLSLSKEDLFSTMQKKEYQEEFMLSIVPVTVVAGAGGEYGLNQEIKLLGITGFDVSVAPFAKIDGFASGGVGVPGFSAGVEADFTFIGEELNADANFKLSLDGNDTTLFLDANATQIINNTITGPKGNIDLYAEYTVPKICTKKFRYCVAWNWHGHCTKHHTKKTHYPCGITTHKPTKNIFSWKSFETQKTLLDEKENIFRVQLY